MSRINLYEITSPAAPSPGQWLVYAKAGGIYARSSSTEVGPLGAALTTAGGDLSGTYPNPSVVGINSIPVDILTPPTQNQALVYDGVQWTPTTIISGTTSAGGDLSGTYPSPTVVGIQNNPVSAASPSVGDVLMWDGSQWVPTAMPSALSAPNFDAFGRLRVSNPQTVFDSKLVYNNQSLYWTESLTGTGVASSYSSNNASVVLIVQDPGDVAIRQTKRYFTYQPGKSQLVFQTFNLNGIVSDITKRVGLFDDYNGLFLELSGGVANLVRRSSSSVFPATLTVPQSSWNLDPLDGTGPSGHNVQWTLTQILVIDYEWLGVGSVRMGFVINGEIVYAHQFNNANVNPYVYMSTPNLPLRYELRGDAVPPPITYATLSCICGSVSSEGGQQSTGTRYGFANTAAVTVSNGASSTLLNLRHETAYPRITIIPQAVNVLAKSNGMSRWELQVGATLSGSAGWPGTTTGYCEINTVDQVTVPGTVIAAGVFSNNAPATNLDLSKTTFTVGSDYAGNSDVLSLVITNLSGGNEQYLSSIDWLALT